MRYFTGFNAQDYYWYAEELCLDEVGKINIQCIQLFVSAQMTHFLEVSWLN